MTGVPPEVDYSESFEQEMSWAEIEEWAAGPVTDQKPIQVCQLDDCGCSGEAHP